MGLDKATESGAGESVYLPPELLIPRARQIAVLALTRHTYIYIYERSRSVKGAY